MLNSKSFSFIWLPHLLTTSGSIVKGAKQNSTSGFILALANLRREKSLWESIS